MAASWLRQHSDYDGGSGLTGLFRRVSAGILHPTAFSSSPRRPDISRRKVSSVTGCHPGNYFDGDVSADAAGIIATLMIMNWLSWQVADMGPEYARSVNIWFPGRMH
jgi:hypothetical protein